MRPPYSYRHDPAVPPFADDKPIIIFDGCCALFSWFGKRATCYRPDARFADRFIA